ncbi:hypothetical protein [Agrobacterium tumefaciens]|uniref:hypothetical protein n=1 Tax=Agrobacterium tumefaciens TaxID=358 RepID=UPI003D9C16C2
MPAAIRGEQTLVELFQPVGVKTLHAKIGELSLENDFLAGVLGKRDFWVAAPRHTDEEAEHRCDLPPPEHIERKMGLAKLSVQKPAAGQIFLMVMAGKIRV